MKGLRHREDQGRWWWELRSCAYYLAFERPKLVYQVIQYHPRYSLDLNGRLANDKAFFLPSEDRKLLAILNSPLMWWFNWRHLTHLKDEALSPMGYKMETIPIASITGGAAAESAAMIDRIIANRAVLSDASNSLGDWLRHEWDLAKLASKGADIFSLDSEGFAGAVRAALPKKRKLTSADFAAMRYEYTKVFEPARIARAEIITAEHKLSDFVNEAYGLTAQDVQLMWDSAPIRMPFMPHGFIARDDGLAPSDDDD